MRRPVTRVFSATYTRRVARRTSLATLAAALLLTLSACGGAAPAEEPEAGDSAPSRTQSPSEDAVPRGEALPEDLSALVESYNASPSSPVDATAAARATGPDRRTFGADVSWPQCPKGMGIPEKRTQGQPMPTKAAEFVVIGLTNGPSFAPNPCVADQVAWARERGLMASAYAVHSFPDESTLAQTGEEGPYAGDTRLGRLRNSGYQAALFNLQTMREAGLRSPIVWVDVEPVPTFEWSSDRQANAAVIQGATRGYVDAGLQVGFYSTPVMWKAVVGDLSLGKPEWRAAGPTSMDEALSRCGRDWSFQGGTALFGQWVEDNRDRNVTCPGQGRALQRWFHVF